MQKLRLQDRALDIVFGSVAIFIVVADQLTKALIRANLAPGQVYLDIGWFSIIHLQNTGASFGLFRGHSLTILILGIVGVIVILLLIILLRTKWSFLQSMWVRVGMALVMGGTIGNNIIDRLWQGHVTDFLDFKVWPAFNVADMSISVGVVIIAYRLIFYSGMFKKEK